MLQLAAVAHADSSVPPDARIDRRIVCGDTTAVFHGHLVDGTVTYQLRFELPKGVKSKWRQVEHRIEDFDLFSPDCSRVLIVRSRYGPIHIVATKRLAAYLHGAAPDFMLDGDHDGISGAGVFRGGGWIDNDQVAYTWGCCDPPITTTITLSTGKTKRAFAPSEANR